MQHTREERNDSDHNRFGAERPISELFADLTRDAGILVSKEVELAKVEMTHKATKIGQDIGFLAAGAAVAYAGILVILAGIVMALPLILPIPLWVSAFIVGLIVALIGFLLIEKGRSDLAERDLTPRHTMQTMKENKEWAQEQLT